MRRVLTVAAIALLALLAAGAIWLNDQLTTLEAETVTEDVHVLFGAGGNVGILATEAGAVIVDTLTFRMQGELVREQAEDLGGGPVQVVLNTHYHQDHSHGNLAFAGGTRFVAATRTPLYMRHFDGDYWAGSEDRMPNELVSDVREIAIGDKTIRAHHLGAGHTGGDIVVLFVEDRVLHTGDLFVNGRYPFIDLPGGGTIPAWIETLDRVLALDFELVIPGHGPVGRREDIVGFQDFLREVWQVAEDAAARGLTLEEMLAEAALTTDAGWEPGGLPPLVVFEREDVLEIAYQEATGSVVAAQIPNDAGSATAR